MKSERKQGEICPKEKRQFDRIYRSLSNEDYQFIRGYSSAIDSISDSDKFNDLSNEELVVLYRSGEVSFEKILSRYLGLIIAKSKQWVPGNYSFQDLFQDLVERFKRTIDRWDPKTGDEKLITYIYKSLDNTVCWRFRKENSENRKLHNEAESYELSLENGYDEIAPENMDKQVVDLLANINLSDRERVCVNMIIEGHRNVDIAETLDLSPNRISQILKGLAPKFQFLLCH